MIVVKRACAELKRGGRLLNGELDHQADERETGETSPAELARFMLAIRQKGLRRTPDASGRRSGVPQGDRRFMAEAVTTLIVDDSADSRDWLRHKLEGLGCLVVGEANSAAQGLERFAALHPRLVTLDLVMPEIDGVAALDLLRRITREDHEVAVLGLTSGR